MAALRLDHRDDELAFLASRVVDRLHSCRDALEANSIAGERRERCRCRDASGCYARAA